MKVLVTGALGNVGEYAVDGAVDEGNEVVAFDLESPRARKVAPDLDERVRVVWGDVTDPTSLAAALDGVDAVVHLAAILTPDQAPELARRVNVDATLSLIEAMEASPSAKRLVFVSSHGIFGEVQDREPPSTPSSEYGRHELACEQAIQQSKLQWSILRLAVAPPTRLIGYSHEPSTPSSSAMTGASSSSIPPTRARPSPTPSLAARRSGRSSHCSGDWVDTEESRRGQRR